MGNTNQGMSKPSEDDVNDDAFASDDGGEETYVAEHTGPQTDEQRLRNVLAETQDMRAQADAQLHTVQEQNAALRVAQERALAAQTPEHRLDTRVAAVGAQAQQLQDAAARVGLSGQQQPVAAAAQRQQQQPTNWLVRLFKGITCQNGCSVTVTNGVNATRSARRPTPGRR